MTEGEFRVYLEGAVKTYAEEKVAAGNWPAEGSVKRSAREFSSLLPEGVASKNNHLFSIWNASDDKTVGMIWFAVEEAKPTAAFIYDFSVHEAHRSKGYGREALLALENRAKALGITAISLHVFGHNRVARALYEKLGYETTNINMTKRLGDDRT